MSEQTVEPRLEAVIRRDGRGEVRDGDEVTPIHGSGADEVRAKALQQVIAAAAERGVAVRLRTVDVDGVYHLLVHPNGKVAEEGAVEPLSAEDTRLRSDEDGAAAGDGPDAEVASPDDAAGDAGAADAATEDIQQQPSPAAPRLRPGSGVDGGYAAEFSPDEAPQDTTASGSSLHETVQLPRPGMLNDSVLLQPAQIPQLLAGTGTAGQTDPAEQTGPPQGEPEWSPQFPRAAAADDDEVTGATAATVGQPTSPGLPAPARTGGANGPTLDDFLADRGARKELPAERGWRASVRRSTGGLLSLGPGAKERAERGEIAAIQRTFDGPRTIVVVNPKGGAHKTTATLMIAALFGIHRGGYTLAWDNNETRGTLGWRSRRGSHNRTAVDLLRQLSHFEISGGATIAEVDRFVRNQGESKFDVLASDDDAASAAIIDAEAFWRLHRTLSRFYRVLVIDTGNNMRASNWEAALDVADQLVIVSTAREDTAASAAWLADGLRERGHGDKLAQAVTILSSPSAKEDPVLTERLRQHFAQLTRAVVEVPYDEEFVGGGELDVPRLRQETRDAWRHAVATVAQGL